VADEHASILQQMMGKLLASSLGFSLQANQDHHSQSPVSSMIDRLIHRRERTIAADIIGSIISFSHISLISQTGPPSSFLWKLRSI
jgi:hypothetical protein